MKGFFITATDTNVGKTIVSALIAKYLCIQNIEVNYHKLIQTFSEQDCDKTTVHNLVNENLLKSSVGLSFKKPLSPHLAAHYANTHIDFSSLIDNFRKTFENKLVITEGAGGLMVPINNSYLMIDAIKKLGLPTILVTRSSLGTINHTLLSIEALRSKNIKIHGLIMIGKNKDNLASIKYYSSIKNIFYQDYLSTVNNQTLTSSVINNQPLWRKFLC